MDKETLEALKTILQTLEYSNKTNDFSYFILNSNNVRNDLIKVKDWLTETRIS
jgi:hypothetical protein